MKEEVTVSNYGEVVACDFCNGGEESMGGTVIGSYAICGDCSSERGYTKSSYEYKDEIDVIFDDEKTFRNNVLEYREKRYGTRDAISTITTF